MAVGLVIETPINQYFHKRSLLTSNHNLVQIELKPRNSKVFTNSKTRHTNLQIAPTTNNPPVINTLQTTSQLSEFRKLAVYYAEQDKNIFQIADGMNVQGIRYHSLVSFNSKSGTP